MIKGNKLLHISGTQDQLSKLPSGNWIGGSSAFFSTEFAAGNSSDKLCVFELDFEKFRFQSYDKKSIASITEDAFENGFTIVIMPAETEILQEFAQNSSNYKDIFLKNVVGWIAGTNNSGKPIVINGQNAEPLTDNAVAMHVELPDDKRALVSVVNIFTADEQSPVIEFDKEGFFSKDFIVDGKKECIVDYAAAHNIDLQLPFVGEYSGSEINTSIVAFGEDKMLTFGAPLFQGIQYRFAKPLDNYAEAFISKITDIPNKECVFSCNCISNMYHGDLQKYDLGGFYGPYVYGEIAYQLVNQTLVYLQIY